ncbi:group II intron reverse transcriptase/maturase [Sorangium sp. So ce1036]|uniref:group II intron reverse transcriptase/maturase n=1 Tax=Sorangium sp. So ce1036 TaxID=3133328 RepID=UPI003F124D2C
MATLGTPTKIRELQRALYLRAKKEPKFRFYALYDKVCRPDILVHAYALAKANGGAPGPDGMTFEMIEANGATALLEELHHELKAKMYRPGPVRRVYIPKLSGGERPLGIPNIRDRIVQTTLKLVLEPIFEADFEPDSYGFRPKRSAHQALRAMREALEQGMGWVIDADLSAYFDTIPHDHLMKAVAERVVDGAVLALIKRFLEAPIVQEREGGHPRQNRQGTPQGGVISPLLANLYLHLLDRNFRRRVERGELAGRLIRYADDFAVLTPRKPDKEMAWVEKIVGRLGLVLHPEKTRILNARKEDFAFLGHQVRWRYRPYVFDLAGKTAKRIRDEIRRRTRRTWMSLEAMIADLNGYIRGARNYFRQVRPRALADLDYFVQQRMARWWARKHALRRPAWSLTHRGTLYGQHGLERFYLPRALRPAPSRGTT